MDVLAAHDRPGANNLPPMIPDSQPKISAVGHSYNFRVMLPADCRPARGSQLPKTPPIDTIAAFLSRSTCPALLPRPQVKEILYVR